jgi:uncharacterized protein
VAVGSLLNKAILVPAALAISAFMPWAITPLLMVGGAYLCFEGFEKLAHKFLHSAEEDQAHHDELVKAIADPQVDMTTFERDKVKGAIRTDFILSAEIIVIALGTVATAPLQTQLAVLVAVSIAMTVGVYGFVAGIVKMDDVGLWLSRKAGAAAQAVGRFLLAAAPRLMKLLTVLGTAAMFLVGGGILVHGIAPLHHAIEQLALGQAWVVAALLENGANALVGVIAGAVVLAGVMAVQKLRGG